MTAFTSFPILRVPTRRPRILACATQPPRPSPSATEPLPSTPTSPNPSPSTSPSPNPSTPVSNSSSTDADGNADATPSATALSEPSVLDDLPSSLKFNAVAAALARNKDHEATLRLLSEMSAGDITLERSTQTAIFDAALNNHRQLADLLQTIRPAGFGSVSPVTPFPCAPVDPTRASDISLAASFLTAVSSAVSAEVLEPLFLHRSPEEPTAFLLFLLGALAIDRYIAASFVWRRIRRGFVRLFSNDPERASRVDAASFLVAYLLGLPWICFRPDGKLTLQWCRTAVPVSTAAEAAAEGGAAMKPEATAGKNSAIDDRIVDRCLLWLLAGVAAEVALDGMLIESDMRPARDFMFGVRLAKPDGKRMSVSEGDNRVRMAVTGVLSLLDNYSELHNELTDFMLSGGSVGECVTYMSERFET